MADWMVTVGDCRDVLAGFEPESVDAVVCDPPYELSFMGKGWDGTGIAYDVAMWAEVLRVLKPGGHLLAFGGTRTFHRMTVAIEDAGFEVRDCLSWLYGSGFPKSLNVGKAIDKRRDDRHEEALAVTVAMAEAMRAKGLTRRDLNVSVGREANDAGSAQSWTTVVADGAHKPRVPTVEQWTVLRDLLDLEWLDDEVWRLNGRKGTPGEAWGDREVVGTKMSGIANKAEGPRHTIGASKAVEVDVTLAATDEARRWEGWGTALKPAWEPIVMARKPLIGTVAGNVLAFGTGGLNIDGSRIAGVLDGDPNRFAKTDGGSFAAFSDSPVVRSEGRWPANVLLDEFTAGLLDEQSGVSKSPPIGSVCNSSTSRDGNILGAATPTARPNGHGDTGGASRFFYVAKASRRDRNEGLDGMEEKEWTSNYATIQDNRPHTKEGYTYSALTKNHHPTVKPTALMRHLVRLVTPPGGLVLDPFTGSGSTGKAAVLEGFRFHGIEQDAEYADIARARIAWAEQQADEEPDQPTLM